MGEFQSDNATELVNDYEKEYILFSNSSIPDETIASKSTQMCFENIQLRKRKLKKANIKENVEFVKKHNREYKKINHYTSNSCIVDTFSKKTDVIRKYTVDGKTAKRKYKKRVININVVNSVQKDGMYPCPNCGNPGKISSYVNGCDYCGSKYKVEDFDTRISSLTIDEDYKGKSAKLILKLMITMGIIFVAMFVGVVALFLTGLFNDGFTVKNSLILILVYGLIKIYWSVLKIYVVIFIAIGIYIIIKSKRIIKNYELMRLGLCVRNLSIEKTVQGVEVLLKKIHFSDDINELNKISEIDLSDALESYKNVFDCSMTRFEVLSCFEKNENEVEMEVKAILFNTMIVNGKIKEENEQIILKLLGRKKVYSVDTSSIRICKCSGCGSTVNIFKGKCDYCGLDFDNRDYSFIVQKYEPKKIMSSYKKTRLGVLVLVGLLVGIFTIVANVGVNKRTINSIKNEEDMYEHVEDLNEKYENVIYRELGIKPDKHVDDYVYNYDIYDVNDQSGMNIYTAEEIRDKIASIMYKDGYEKTFLDDKIGLGLKYTIDDPKYIFSCDVVAIKIVKDKVYIMYTINCTEEDNDMFSFDDDTWHEMFEIME